MPEGASESEAAHLRMASPEKTRSQHQAIILTILRLLPGPSIGHHAGVRRCLKPQVQVHPVPIRKFICNLIRQTSQPWESRALAMCFSSLNQVRVRSHNPHRATATVCVRSATLSMPRVASVSSCRDFACSGAIPSYSRRAMSPSAVHIGQDLTTSQTLCS
ncbi:hypothetical protein BU25DRAFT_66111 [Macroventuria anomochaeta]|uniref:Uncharacterized protein n=1 Tax=Macroventuria anomochaeta TaxID=301207 RepID=A0ACB6S0I4_9PLEO|nr:uncharacterized protein BU25DRAFT_66111 [Macroventuria anomochaeta]KAF2627482.1 hypothetical protein BU25DRAFT_66111 [Macroventuria anomochaeta]